MEIIVKNAKGSLTKNVKQQGNGGYIYLPKSWVGEVVAIVLLDENAKVEKKE